MKNNIIVGILLTLVVVLGALTLYGYSPRVRAALSDGTISFGTKRLINLGAPTAGTSDAATTSWVASQISAAGGNTWAFRNLSGVRDCTSGNCGSYSPTSVSVSCPAGTTIQGYRATIGDWYSTVSSFSVGDINNSIDYGWQPSGTSCTAPTFGVSTSFSCTLGTIITGQGMRHSLAIICSK